MPSPLNVINTQRFSQHLRTQCVDVVGEKVLISRYDDSEMSEDFSVPMNCHNFGRVHRFVRGQGDDWPPNPLPIDPALKALGLPPSDSVSVQVFQIAGCSWRCWYCFVDFEMLSASRKRAEFLTVDQLIDYYLEYDGQRPPIIDLSGGQPDLVPEWGLWFADAIQRRGLSEHIYIWSDDNLSNDYLWRFLTTAELSRLASHFNYGRVGCFKGYDDYSFSFNTRADPKLFNDQFTLMRRLVDAGFDVYGYVTLTSDQSNDVRGKIKRFVDRLQREVHEVFPLRVVPLEIRRYTPTARRMGPEHKLAIENQALTVELWRQELAERYGSAALQKKIYAHGLAR